MSDKAYEIKLDQAEFASKKQELETVSTNLDDLFIKAKNLAFLSTTIRSNGPTAFHTWETLCGLLYTIEDMNSLVTKSIEHLNEISKDLQDADQALP